jgi:beta-ureidopropionase / N-carbamoyl-L-amino-acid hydrolase
MPNVRAAININADRLWDDIMATAAIGATAKGGLHRLTLSDSDRQVRDWFKARATALGLAIAIDDMGNMFARRRGRSADLPAIALGSHLDTQPSGGRFDGVLGVLGALEAIRTLGDVGYETFAPLEVVNWTNEEGARFAPAMLASGVFAGVFDRDWACSRMDRAGVTFKDALDAIGYRGSEACGARAFSAYFELHIEQGPVLEAQRREIGIVTGIQGVRWYEATITGQDAHTGATPMLLRKNALLGAAQLVGIVDAIARNARPPAVGTVGSMEVKPNSPNVVPGEVRFTVDFRHPEAAVLDEMERQFMAAVGETCGALGLEGQATKIWDSPTVKFDPKCIAAVRDAAAQRGLSAYEMLSGAGHDAAYVARVAPTAMIFVPCRGGLSHNEAEFSSKEQCAAGAQVLLQAALAYDRGLAENRS